jgi:hypothetical protein
MIPQMMTQNLVDAAVPVLVRWRKYETGVNPGEWALAAVDTRECGLASVDTGADHA